MAWTSFFCCVKDIDIIEIKLYNNSQLMNWICHCLGKPALSRFRRCNVAKTSEKLISIEVSLDDDATRLWNMIPFDPRKEKVILLVHARSKLSLGIRMPVNYFSGDMINWVNTFTIFNGERLALLLRTLTRTGKGSLIRKMTLSKVFK